MVVDDKTDAHLDIPIKLKNILVEDRHYVKELNKIVKLPPAKTINQLLEDYISDRCDRETKKRNGKQDTSEESKNVFQSENFGANYIKSGCSEMINGLKEYFNQVINVLILYKPEQTQYEHIIKLLAENDSKHDMSEKVPIGSIDGKIRSRKNSNSTKNIDMDLNKKQVSESNSSQIANNYPPNHYLTAYYSPIHLLRLFTKLPKLLTLVPIDEKAVKIVLPFFGDLIDYMKEHYEEIFPAIEYVSV